METVKQPDAMPDPMHRLVLVMASRPRGLEEALRKIYVMMDKLKETPGDPEVSWHQVVAELLMAAMQGTESARVDLLAIAVNFAPQAAKDALFDVSMAIIKSKVSRANLACTVDTATGQLFRMALRPTANHCLLGVAQGLVVLYPADGTTPVVLEHNLNGDDSRSFEARPFPDDEFAPAARPPRDNNSLHSAMHSDVPAEAARVLQSTEPMTPTAPTHKPLSVIGSAVSRVASHARGRDTLTGPALDNGSISRVQGGRVTKNKSPDNRALVCGPCWFSGDGGTCDGIQCKNCRLSRRRCWVKPCPWDSRCNKQTCTNYHTPSGHQASGTSRPSLLSSVDGKQYEAEEKSGDWRGR